MASPGETFGNYELGDSLPRPEGSVTEAFRALDVQRGGIEVVVEIVRAGATSVEKARFGTRARRLQGAEHSCLLEMFEVAATHCVRELVFGEPLTEHAGVAIARARQKLAWLSQIAGAVAALHKAGLTHGRLDLGDIVVSPDTSVKLIVPLGGDVSGSPLDDVRAFGAIACDLVLGTDIAPTSEEKWATDKLHEAGLPFEAAQMIARARVGSPINSAELAEKLAPFADYAGPSTEPLLEAVPAVNPRRTNPM